jgi:hypothetical protein
MTGQPAAIASATEAQSLRRRRVKRALCVRVEVDELGVSGVSEQNETLVETQARCLLPEVIPLFAIQGASHHVADVGVAWPLSCKSLQAARDVLRRGWVLTDST